MAIVDLSECQVEFSNIAKITEATEYLFMERGEISLN